MSDDTRPETILYLLRCQGLTYADIDRRFDLAAGSARKAVRYPMRAGELAIAEVLGRAPRDLWPSRYNANGERKRPQPRTLYTHPVRLRRPAKPTPTGEAGQRQKDTAA
ncbi:helix-turn-helix domain-containing protein [Roseospirillum parvum]|uniref:Ner family transcriptional regulator n=1 Tax=Roseospirillum parvum TaxID=83401 RepID=A0A1G8G7B6_9PROT|nr:helix-turn-helix domain-containing protein [Roseospirillum parvum]SDH90292.1 Ner family transcriptional regulator [Roseospirillum parvum]